MLTGGFLALAMGLTVGTAQGADSPGRSHSGHSVVADRAGTDHRGGYDARRGTGSAAQARLAKRAAAAARRPATRHLKRSLGDQAVLDIDGTTGTPRLVGMLDGFLTGRSTSSPRSIVLSYVRAHKAAFGLTESDVKSFSFRQDYVDIAGTHHLSWTQRIGGIDVFGNGLTAAVTKDGRLLMVGGSPVTGADPAPGGSVTIGSSNAAISSALQDSGDNSAPTARDDAKQVLFVTRSGTYLAWRVVAMSASEPALSVLDAHSGRVLYRQSLTSDANAPDSGGVAYPYFPGHVPGGQQLPVNYTARGWLPGNAHILSGNNSHTYSDVNDDNLPDATEEVPPSSGNHWNYPLVPFHLPDVSFCDNPYPCSWDPNTPFSWQTNRAQNAEQVFFFVNNWHDHLKAAPIGFTEAAGNFQAVNKGHAGEAGDAVDTQTDDGANTDAGLPDGGHIDNANMSTPPDGQAPTMQMYLQHQPGTTYPDGDPFAPTNVGDEADTVYHEYTHGLSNRLVVDSGGNSTLGDVEAGAMGEAWSDWYAMDYLVDHHLQADKPGVVDVVLFQYDGAGVALDRTQPIDCKVGSAAEQCNGGATGHGGGYTYADYGKVIGFPEVHADGEIWSETLWDLRDRLGSDKTESLVTRAMELSPSNPSMLDERNAILMADSAVFGGRDRDKIWSVFAHRGMGYYAGSLGGDDSAPGADFHTPPRHPDKAFVTGTVTSQDGGAPVAGVTVSLAFQGGAGIVNPSATTGADGKFRIGPVPVGTYPKLFATAPGFEPGTISVTVTRHGGVGNIAIRRDWAAASGGATISDFNGPDFSPQCGPEGAIDLSQGTGWGSTTGDDDGDPTNVFVPKHITVALTQAVDLTGFAVDPTATCGDGGSASTGDYSIETSPDGTTWTTAASGTFTADNQGLLNPVDVTAGGSGVQFVRFNILSNQTPDFATSCPDGAFAGCSFTDLTELEVFGAPAS